MFTAPACLLIPDLSRLAGIAGLLNPSSCCTERLVKQHKCGVMIREIREKQNEDKIMFETIVRGRFTKDFDEINWRKQERPFGGLQLKC